MKVRYTPEAAERFLQVLTDLAALNPLAAERFARLVERQFTRLASFPQSGFGVRAFSRSTTARVHCSALPILLQRR